jgi:hypothetical protein
VRRELARSGLRETTQKNEGAWKEPHS